jgi:hypothetical protein
MQAGLHYQPRTCAFATCIQGRIDPDLECSPVGLLVSGTSIGGANRLKDSLMVAVPAENRLAPPDEAARPRPKIVRRMRWGRWFGTAWLGVFLAWDRFSGPYESGV